MRMRAMAGVAGMCVGGAAWGQGAAVETTTPMTTQVEVQDAPKSDAPAGPSSELIEGRDPNKWEWSIEPAGWFVGVSGKLRMPRSGAGASEKFTLEELNMDNPRFAPMLEINGRRGDWRGTFRGVFFGADRDTTGLSGTLGDLDLAPGDTVHSSLDIGVLELEGAYTFAGKPQDKRSDGTYSFDPRLDAVVGVRLYGTNWEVQDETGGASQKEDGWFVQPHLGLKLSTEVYERFTIDAQVTFGGLPEKDNYSLDVIVGGQWHPWEHMGVQVGYRALFFGMSEGGDSGDMSFTGSLQGLYGGVVVRF